MGKKTICTAAFLAAAVLVFSKAPYETVETLDGSIFMGHTSAQDYTAKNAKTVFQTDSAIRVLPLNKINISEPEIYDLGRMPSLEWENWFAIHPEYVNMDNGGKKTVKLHRINDPEKNYHSLGYILEKGPKYVKVYDIQAFSDIIQTDSIISTKYALRDPLALNGVINVITTKNNDVYKGQIVSQDNKNIGIKTDMGYVTLVPAQEIVSIEYLPLNPDFPLVEQADFIEEIITENGDYNGIIVSRVFKTGNDQKPYYEISDGLGHSKTKVNTKDIKSIRKRINKDYKPLLDAVVPEENAIVINGVKIDSIPFKNFKDSKMDLDGFILKKGAEPTKIKVKDGETVTLYMKNIDLNSKISLIKIEPRNFSSKEIAGPRYFFGYKELVDNARDIQKTATSKNGNKMTSYALTAGTYLIYRNNDKMAYLIKVEK